MFGFLGGCSGRKKLDFLLKRSKHKMAVHFKCRNSNYPCAQQTVARRHVPDDKVPWTVDWPEYSACEYTLTLSKPWEDPRIDDASFKPKWNSLDGGIDRRSHEGKYEIIDGYPHNPRGRTGVRGRGCLGRWGPNHAADPIVTRWKRSENNEKVIHPISGLALLQFVAIQRHDNGQWAIPGGMVDPGEQISTTLKREFCEEAVNSLMLSDQEKNRLETALANFFKAGKEVYRGYVDDPRNTDNSWMETVAFNFHDDTGETVNRVALCAGDDAAKVQWTDIGKDLHLYASHIDFLKVVADLLKAHW